MLILPGKADHRGTTVASARPESERSPTPFLYRLVREAPILAGLTSHVLELGEATDFAELQFHERLEESLPVGPVPVPET